MFEWQDLLQWDRFITPTIVRPFYWIAIALCVLFALHGVFTSLAAMAINPFAGFLAVLMSLVGGAAGIFLARILSEFVLIAFRINEQLGALRDERLR